ncbi:MFS transporter [Arthrobacter sp. P2b]|uniref:MFS transporter n=1 Tax=Arthrobacter sp. P2b TaxID=1938741 RepID=UPI0009CAF21A|nr:MFS transporter [Arthrobacter sp. P2b]SLK10572.1 Major Facilitator Superfamily protein [Arthrobacter sp. P2b]
MALRRHRFITLVFGTTTVNVLFNVLGAAMVKELGWERSILSNGLSIQIGLAGISVIILGFLTDRWGPRIPAALMALIFGLGILALGTLQDTEVAFYLICALIGFASGSANPVVHAGVLSAWFSDKRGIALGILMAGLGTCGFVMPFLANSLLSIGGWRLSFIIIGLLCVIIPGSVYAFVTRMPAAHDAERVKARQEGRTAAESL